MDHPRCPIDTAIAAAHRLCWPATRGCLEHAALKAGSIYEKTFSYRVDCQWLSENDCIAIGFSYCQFLKGGQEEMAAFIARLNKGVEEVAKRGGMDCSLTPRWEFKATPYKEVVNSFIPSFAIGMRYAALLSPQSLAETLWHGYCTAEAALPIFLAMRGKDGVRAVRLADPALLFSCSASDRPH